MRVEAGPGQGVRVMDAEAMEADNSVGVKSESMEVRCARPLSGYAEAL